MWASTSAESTDPAETIYIIRYMKAIDYITRTVITVVFMLTAATAKAQPQYTRSDSVRVETMLKSATAMPDTTNWMLFFGRKMLGVPYVAKTLEGNESERLVVNTRQLDCTTFVETTLALTLCAKNRLTRFADFLTFLRLIRYRNGEVSYANRLHYFTAWIADNGRMGYVEEISGPNPPFSAVQKVSLSFMTSHTQLYPMMAADTTLIARIAQMEREFSGREYPYIPKDRLANSEELHSVIHDGDIIAILTSKAGLDTTHIGIAIWHADGLHLLNASQIRHKVVDEPMTLYTYMQRHPTQTGIRVLHVNQ